MKKLFFWTLFVSSSFYLEAQSWLINGNGNINPATHFLGTTNNVPLLIRVNNVQSGKVASDGFVSLGYEANKVNIYATNTAIGHQALKNITTGADWTTALGYQAGISVTSGWNSTFIGFRAGYGTTTGKDNTAVGTYALGGDQILSSTTGNSNTALGSFSLFSLSTGVKNTALGFRAGTNDFGSNGFSYIDNYCTFLGAYASRDYSVPTTTALTNATAIGYNARVGASNTLILGGQGSEAVNVGIGNIAPQNKLEITQGTAGNSGLRFTNLTSSSTASTSSGKVLSVNANGDVVLEVAGGTPPNGSETIVQAGTNVTVSGNGTSSTPYIISSTGGISYWNASPIGSGNVINSNTGGVIIGTGITILPSGYKLYVSDGILAEKVKVALKSGSNWADYVFAKDYRLTPLAEVESFIKVNKHLLGIPSAETLVKEGGIDVNQMFAKQMEKIEELTLYIIETNKKLEKLQNENSSLKSASSIVNQ